MLQQLFTANGYGSIFVTNQPRGELCTMILSATTDKDEYTDAHDVIHISFDAIIAGKQVLICISQQTENPDLAEQIFSTFKWLKYLRLGNS